MFQFDAHAGSPIVSLDGAPAKKCKNKIQQLRRKKGFFRILAFVGAAGRCMEI